MSYIHEALKKAQEERDAFYIRHSRRSMTGRGGGTGFFHHRTVLWFVSVFILIFLAFATYSWFKSQNLQSMVTSDSHEKTPSQDLRPVPFVDTKDIYVRARLLQKQGNLEEAGRLYREILGIEPGYVDALNNLAVICIRKKDFKGARSNLEKAIRFRPGYVDSYYNLACVSAIQGEASQSIIYLKKAISLDRSVRQWAMVDDDLKSLRGLPLFKELIGAYPEAKKGE